MSHFGIASRSCNAKVLSSKGLKILNAKGPNRRQFAVMIVLPLSSSFGALAPGSSSQHLRASPYPSLGPLGGFDSAFSGFGFGAPFFFACGPSSTTLQRNLPFLHLLGGLRLLLVSGNRSGWTQISLSESNGKALSVPSGLAYACYGPFSTSQIDERIP